MNELVPVQNLIYEIRGHKVMLDSDLAKLYQVETFNLNKAVKRNVNRFPEDFMFQLTKEEYRTVQTQTNDSALIFQNGISKNKRGGRRFMPYAFTEQGVAMLSSVLNSENAIAVNIQIMRVFVKMKQFALEHKDLSEQIAELRKYFIQYAKDNSSEIERIDEAINLLMDRTKPLKMGFKID